MKYLLPGDYNNELDIKERNIMIIIAEYYRLFILSAVVRIKFIDILACLSYITAAFLTSVGFSIFSITFQNVLFVRRWLSSEVSIY